MKGHPFGHALFFTFGLAALAPAIAGSLGGTLELADEGNFFVGGQVALTRGTGHQGSVATGRGRSARNSLALEPKAFVTLFGSIDQKEGMNAFLEKRKPKFIGC